MGKEGTSKGRKERRKSQCTSVQQLPGKGEKLVNGEEGERRRAVQTSRSAGSGLAGLAIMGPTSFTFGGSGRGTSSAMSPLITCSTSSRRASGVRKSMPCLRLIRQHILSRCSVYRPSDASHDLHIMSCTISQRELCLASVANRSHKEVTDSVSLGPLKALKAFIVARVAQMTSPWAARLGRNALQIKQ